jgi:hypothetical protein
VISIPKNLRSAAIVALAVGALAGTSALAANLSAPGQSHHSDSKSSPAPKATTHAAPGESTDVTGQSRAETVEPTVVDTDKADPDAHGDCVSKIARDHTQTEVNKNGKHSHGAWVSDWAHSCPIRPTT